MTTRDLLLHTWDPSLAVTLLCAASVVTYGLLCRARLSPRSLYFLAAIAGLFVALASPIGVLAKGYLFSAHMLQHLLLLLVVPLLALLGLPVDARRDARAPQGSAKMLTFVPPWLAGVGGMWFWHEPTLCNLAATNAEVRFLQTASLLGMGVLFWRPVLGRNAGEGLPPLAATVYLFAACFACSILGILLTFSPVTVCSVYAYPIDKLGVMPLLRNGWGLSPHEDQQIGGLLMWVPTCFVYVSAILATLGRYYREQEAQSPHGKMARALTEVR